MSIDIENFCDDGALMESRKPRGVVWNVYDGENGPKNARYHIFFHDNLYWLKSGNFLFPLDPLGVHRFGSYSI